MSQQVIFDKKNVLVTGGAGFIGSHLCEELLRDHKVICLDDFSTGDERNIDHLLDEPDFEFVKHDINEPLELEELPELQKFKIQFQGIQDVYHLACPMSARNFLANRIHTLTTTSVGTKNVLDLAVKNQSKFIHISSSVVYGKKEDTSDYVQEDELGRADMLSERSQYDEGKRFAETMVKNYAREYKLDAKIMRLFRTYGPRMKLDDGQLIPDFINKCLDGEKIQLPGDESFASSFCYVSDAIDAILKLMESNEAGPVNIGSDVEVKLVDIAKNIQKLIGREVEMEFTEDMVFITPLCLPSITKARNDLGWMPVVSLDKGLEKTIYDLRANKGLKGVRHAV